MKNLFKSIQLMIVTNDSICGEYILLTKSIVLIFDSNMIDVFVEEIINEFSILTSYNNFFFSFFFKKNSLTNNKPLMDLRTHEMSNILKHY